MPFNWGGHHGDDEFEYNYDTDFYVDLDFDTDNFYESDIEISYDFDLRDGDNRAVFNVDVQAIGDEGATELNLVVVTSDNYSSIVATGYSYVD